MHIDPNITSVSPDSIVEFLERNVGSFAPPAIAVIVAVVLALRGASDLLELHPIRAAISLAAAVMAWAVATHLGAFHNVPWLDVTNLWEAARPGVGLIQESVTKR